MVAQSCGGREFKIKFCLQYTIKVALGHDYLPFQTKTKVFQALHEI